MLPPFRFLLCYALLSVSSIGLRPRHAHEKPTPSSHDAHTFESEGMEDRRGTTPSGR